MVPLPVEKRLFGINFYNLIKAHSLLKVSCRVTAAVFDILQSASFLFYTQQNVDYNHLMYLKVLMVLLYFLLPTEITTTTRSRNSEMDPSLDCLLWKNCKYFLLTHFSASY